MNKSKQKTDIEIMAEQKNKMTAMTEYQAFEYMKKKNLPYYQAPWDWGRKRKVPCSRCGSNTIYEKDTSNGILTLVQCMSAVRTYYVSPASG